MWTRSKFPSLHSALRHMRKTVRTTENNDGTVSRSADEVFGVVVVSSAVLELPIDVSVLVVATVVIVRVLGNIVPLIRSSSPTATHAISSSGKVACSLVTITIFS